MEVATMTETATMAKLPLSMISPSTFNPRRHFDEAEMAELTECIKVKGVIQAINVRPLPGGGYEIVAGERRYRAALAAHGAEYEIPALVNELSDDEAEQIALVENTQRADMSISEEAAAAGRVLERVSGDRDEAAKVLGWPLSKLNRRVALLNLVSEAMDALTRRVILVGHAELLAAIPQDKQVKALGNIIDKKLSVQDVKKVLVNIATDFKTAIFDTTRCTTCKYNSTIQSSLFSESIGANDRCTNTECFTARTSTKIGEIKFSLAEEVQTVKVIEVGDNGFVKLNIDGPAGVGAEQYEACKVCANKGATVSNIPGEVGRVERDICFDTDCHLKLAAARIKAEKAVSAQLAGETKNKKTAGGTGAGTASGAAAPKEQKKVAGLSAKIIEYRRKEVWEKAAMKELAGQINKARSFALDLLLTGDGRLMDRDKLVGYYDRIAGEAYPEESRYSGKKVGFPEKTHELTADQQDKLFAAAAVSAVTSSVFEDERLKKLLGFLETDLSKHFTLTEALLNLLTKSEIEAVSVSVGLDKAVPDFKKVLSGKRDDAIKAILAAPFQFAGALPSILNYC